MRLVGRRASQEERRKEEDLHPGNDQERINDQLYLEINIQQFHTFFYS